MRSFAPSRRSTEPSPYRAGFTAGVITTLIIAGVGVALARFVDWASARSLGEMADAFNHAITTPVLSVVDLMTLAFLGLMVLVILALLSTFGGVTS